MNENFKPEDLKYILDHLFLPPRLPKGRDEQTRRKDGVLLSFLHEASIIFIDDLKTSASFSNEHSRETWERLSRMLSCMATLHCSENLIQQEVEDALQNMEINDVLPLFVDSQNAGVIFRKESSEYLSFECFELSLPCETIIGTTGKVIVQFPANPRLPVSTSSGTLQSIANILAFLDATTIGDAMPVTHKGGSQHIEVRDTASPRYITEALAGVLRGAAPDSNIVNPTIYIQKRLDDHVLWTSAFQPWRRSSLLLLSRIALQTTLKEANLKGYEGYKAFQAFAMGVALSKACRLDQSILSSDLLHEMNKKLAKRLWKMRDEVDRQQSGPLRSAGDAVINTAGVLNSRWERIRKHFSKALEWSAPEDQEIRKAITFSLPNSNQFLKTLIQRSQDLSKSSDAINSNQIDNRLVLECHERIPTINTAALPPLECNKEQELRLHDVEIWITINLTSWTSSPFRVQADCRSLSEFLEDYVSLSMKAYKDQPELLSHMYLCMLELWVALDTITLKFCPLLAEYSPEIPTDLLDSLLLPYFSQMQRLISVENYLKERHSTASKCGNTSIFSNPNRSSSFANRYFMTSRTHQDLRSKMHEREEEQKVEKRAELERLNEQHRTLKANAHALTCNDTRVWDRRRWCHIERHVATDCHRCRLEREASNLSITPLESLLPVDDYLAQPIVFELDCPEAFGAWRDSTHTLLARLQKKPQYPGESFWALTKYSGLQHFFTPKGFRVSYASSAKPISVSHYGRGSALPATESSVIHPHAGHYQLFDTSNKIPISIVLDVSPLRAHCTLKLEGSFQPLQCFVEGTKHTSNQVMASQSTSPRDVSLSQYVAFGHLRAGNKIQWWNVMRILRTQSLPLSHSDVYILLVQTIWQAGPEEEYDVHREAHAGLLNLEFRSDAIKELDETIITLGKNWREPLSLAAVVTIASRMYSLTPSKDRGQILKVLENARAVATEWIQLAKMEMKSLGPDASVQCRFIISQLAAVFRSSYDVEFDPNEISVLLSTPESFVSFLHATILTASSGVQEASLTSAVRLLFRRDRRLGYRMENILRSTILHTPQILHAAIERHWSDYSRGTQWRTLPKPADRWLVSTTTDRKPRTIHFNVLNGTLLVNGGLSGRLPSQYTSHSSFKTLFGDSEALLALPSTMPGMKYQVNFKGQEVHFVMVGDYLVIRVRIKDRVEEYVPANLIARDVPTSLTNGHIHWYIEPAGQIEFRPRNRMWMSRPGQNWSLKLFSHAARIQGPLEKTFQTGTKFIMDPHSAAYTTLRGPLLPLEPDPCGLLITITDETTSLVVIARLPRLKLEFLVDLRGMHCQSIPGYTLDTEQSLGTWYGLKNYVVLREQVNYQAARKVIIPKGFISAAATHQGHPLVEIDCNKHTGCLVYEVDSLVGRLIGNRTLESDLYLVELHACTSSPFPDPLTGKTGTEEALDRLSGASFYSIQDLPPHWSKRLDNISSLSPRREYYPQHLAVMEKVTWHPSLPVTSQHPGFRRLTSNIRSYWQEVSAFQAPHLEFPAIQELKGMAHLSDRAMNRTINRENYSLPLLDDSGSADSFFHCRDSLLDAQSQTRERLSYRVAASATHRNESLQVCECLDSVIGGWRSVQGVQSWDFQEIQNWFSASMPEIWCTFYYHVRQGPTQPTLEVVMALSFLAYRGASLPLIGTLISVAKNSEFGNPDFSWSRKESLDIQAGERPEEEVLKGILGTCAVEFKDSDEVKESDAVETTHPEYLPKRDTAVRTYESEKEKQIQKVVDHICQTFPHLGDCANLPPQRLLSFTRLFIDNQLRPRLMTWSDNLYFLQHVRKVMYATMTRTTSTSTPSLYKPVVPKERHIRTCPVRLNIQTICALRTPPGPSSLSNNISLDNSSHSSDTDSYNSQGIQLESLQGDFLRLARSSLEETYLEQFTRSIEAFHAYPAIISNGIPPLERLEQFARVQDEVIGTSFVGITQALSALTFSDNVVQSSGMWPCTSTRQLLGLLSHTYRKALPSPWKEQLYEFTEHVLFVQRARRLLRYALNNQPMEFCREIQEGRKPLSAEQLDWMLIEIDSNMSIRSTQVAVANAMINPEQKGNIVMQLNMGEGKSSMIVPIVASSLADRTCLVRTIVLKPQSKQQFHLLRQRLCDLANRRIVYLPFNRNTNIGPATIQSLRRILQECLEEGGVLLSQPEYILSFKLLGLDKLMRNEVSIGRQLVEIELWLQKITRDILDESDEILHTRHQLIYSVGQQTNLNAAPARWEIIEAVLALLLRQVQSTTSESFSTGPSHSSAQFPLLRMMSDGGRRIIISTAEDIVWKDAIPFIRFKHLSAELKTAAVEFITSFKVGEGPSSLLRAFQENQQDQFLWEALLILRCLVAYDVLALVLRDKRWRVEYGLDLRRSQLAVPYRAKDSPSLRSEFAHPDVLILLTCLSYYYQGLTDSMIVRTIKSLMRSDMPDLIYQEWVSACWADVPPALRTTVGINMNDDNTMVQSLRPFLKHNVAAINFFLNTCVFPREAKEFPFKMSTSGWDLAMEKQHITTGFSGTNDSRYLLPTSISQLDSSEQLHTNAKVLALLLKEENSMVLRHPSHLTSIELLDQVMALTPRPTVFLDVGAQVLDNSNQDFSLNWLSRYDESSTIKAAVFFDEDDNICTITRDGVIQLLLDSPYLNRMDECLIYLDDVHTRGTDLKLPPCRAAVTLGPKLTKDKLVQGCMRMRKLGTDHSVIFLAPQEVVKVICETTHSEIDTLKTSGVLLWAMLETCRQLQANAPTWALQGHAFANRAESWKELSQNIGSISMRKITDWFCERDGRTLSQLYDTVGRSTDNQWLESLHTASAPNPTSRAIFARCQSFGMFSFGSAKANEEQEVELMHEKEVEREVERPPLARKAEHNLHRDVTLFVKTGRLPSSEAFRPVHQAFTNTSLTLPRGIEQALSSIYVTEDFYRTILESGGVSAQNMDEFLRPVEWVVSQKDQSNTILVVLSPFEVNHLLPEFEESSKVHLHMFASRSSLSMRTLEDLVDFTIPAIDPLIIRSPSSIHQLNLFSGSLYLRDYKTYKEICSALRLHFGPLSAHLVEAGSIDSSGFVKSAEARQQLGLTGTGFEESPVAFFRKLFTLRRHGRGFLPSHLGQILYGLGLTENSFVTDDDESGDTEMEVD